MRQENLALSPDGHKLAVQSRENEIDMWVYDVDRGVKTRFTFDSAVHSLSAWTPSGDEIAYAATRNGNFDIFSKPSNGNGEARLLVSTPLDERAPDWSSDQRFLIYMAGSRETKNQLLYRERREDGSLGEPRVFLKTSFNEADPRFSPDGRLVAYVSDESGRNEIHVRDFPNGANKWLISANGGTAPHWRRDGKEIFYVEQGKLMAVSVIMEQTFSPGVPARLFGNRFLQIGYDVTSDGKRFVVLDRPAGEPPLSIHVVHNWFEEFRGRQ
jgi:Tol biopolymer transport system component